MSHVIRVKSQVKLTDAEMLKRTCSRMGLPAPVHGKHEIEGAYQSATGWRLQFPNWRNRYLHNAPSPVVVDTDAGDLLFDDEMIDPTVYTDAAEHQADLDWLQQEYKAQAIIDEAAVQGDSVEYHGYNRETGQLRLTIQTA